MKKFVFIILFLSSAALGANAIQIVGSSTVYPFSTLVSERFTQILDYSAIVESTGSGGGLQLFCRGAELETPSIANSSRAIKASEIKLCAQNGVTDVIEVKIGYDGIVIVQTRSAEKINLDRRHLFLALAKKVLDENQALIDNPYQTWKDIAPHLPDTTIKVYGPPPTSGTRDAFVELVMENGCKTFPSIVAMEKKKQKAVCHALREDGVYVEAGENDNLIIQKVFNQAGALGILGFSFLESNRDRIRGVDIESVAPEFETIADGSYPVARPLFFYVKKEHYGKVKGLKEFVDFFISEDVLGEEGILADRGLIPLPEEEYETMRDTIIKATKSL